MAELSYDSKVEKYDEQTGDLYMRTFGIAEGLVTSNNWLAKNIMQYGKSLIGKWIIDHEKTKGIHGKYTNLAKWLKDSQKAAIATITGIDVNEQTGALDVIYKVTDPDSKADVLAAIKSNKPIKWKFSSPAIWGYKLRRDPNTGTIIYDEWEGVHVAVFSKKVNPAFPAGIAKINENICVGGIKCANELAAVAVKLEDDTEQTAFIPHGDPDIILSNLGEKFTLDKSGIPLKPDNIKMSAEDGNTKTKTVPYEEYIKKANEVDSLTTKYNESLKVNEKIAKDKADKDTAFNELNEKWTARQNEDKKKSFTEKLSKIFEGEELDQKVNFALEKKYDDAVIDQLYGPLLTKAEEQEKANQKETLRTIPKAGVASNSKMDNSIKENIDVALSIANQRKRVF